MIVGMRMHARPTPHDYIILQLAHRGGTMVFQRPGASQPEPAHAGEVNAPHNRCACPAQIVACLANNGVHAGTCLLSLGALHLPQAGGPSGPCHVGQTAPRRPHQQDARLRLHHQLPLSVVRHQLPLPVVRQHGPGSQKVVCPSREAADARPGR